MPDHGEFLVTEQQEQGGCVVYFGRDEEGSVHPIPEQILGSHIKLNGPRERMLAGQLEHHRRFALRIATDRHRARLSASRCRGLLGPRVQLLPHQLYLAREIASRPAARVLLADEVGLGKTIEAGLILHQLLTLDRARRALIMVPDSLVHQWLVEMLRRFNLQFTVLDEARCAADDIDLDSSFEAIFGDDDASPAEAENLDNPFDSAQLVLCAIDWPATDFERQQQILDTQWDVLIVDEAHHLQWQEDGRCSPSYALVEQLAAQTPSVLLLTATPENAGIDGHFARLRLLDPQRYHSLSAFREEQNQYGDITALIEGLRDQPASTLASADSRAALQDYLGEEKLSALADGGDSALIEKACHELLDRFGTGRMLYRNTRQSVGGFPRRVLIGHELDNPLTDSDAELQAQLQPERGLGEDWLRSDPRVRWLEKWLLQQPDDKVLLICGNADTAEDLELYLRLRRGIASAVFHEHLSLIERDRAAAYFAESEDGAQLLLCSEIGSEGRNFQFAQHLVLFDLPLNPDLLEQRIGRLDRIGKQGDVQIQLPYYRNSAQARLLRWYDEALGIFSAPCTIGAAMQQRYAEALEAALVNPDITVFEALLEDARETANALRDDLGRGRNRLLELNSCRPRQAAELVATLEAEQGSEALAEYLEQLADQFGLEHEHHSEDAIILRPGEHMLTEAFPHLPDEGISGSFNREKALSREDLAWFSWEHPLVRDAMAMISDSDFGSATLCTLPVKGLSTGSLLLEAYYRPVLQAPMHLQLSRYLPADSLREVIDQESRKLSHAVSHDKLNQLCKSVKKNLIPALLRQVREPLVAMIDEMESLSQEALSQWRQSALERHAAERRDERQRLAALIARSPELDEGVLADFDSETDIGQQALQALSLSMSGLRLAIVN